MRKSFFITLEDICLSEWEDIHNWCREQFGIEHYTWTGSRIDSKFWFETEQMATLFALRWR